MHDDIKFQTEVDCGFDLPAAFKTHNDHLNQMVAIAVLVASVCAATIIGAQIIFG